MRSEIKMEQRSVSETIKEFEPLLRKVENDDELTIIQATNEVATQAGDNYMSIVVRTKIIGRHGDGTPYAKDFITKCIPQRSFTEFIKTADLFFNEVHAYDKVLPLLGSFAPRRISANCKKIVMEDLKQYGYVNCDRKEFLDLDHCIYALQTMATFHARSLALKLRDPSTFAELSEPLKEPVFPKEPLQTIHMSLEGALKTAVKHLESIEPRTDEIDDALRYVESYSNKCYDTIRELLSWPDKKYHVICHGDTWTNNLLFQHDYAGKITDLKFVDYQIMRHTSVAMDFLYFLYSSVRASVFDNDFEQLVKSYHQAFAKELRKLDVPEEDRKNLTVDWLKAELKRYAAYGLLSGFWLTNAVMAEGEDIIDMDKITNDDIKKMTESPLPIRAPKVQRMKSIVLHFIRTFT